VKHKRRRRSRTTATASATIRFEASSRAGVDERTAWLRNQGAEIESEPQEYGYMPGYYAVFFYDPDGIKLEILHVPGLAA
jgi:predicted lactoylglutathione lyase